MRQFFSSHNKAVLIGALLLIGVIAALLITGRLPQQNNSQIPATPTGHDTPAVSPVSAVSESPVSPISPVSPVSPPPLSPSERLNPDEITAMVQQGLHLHETGDYEAAIELFDDLLAHDARNFIAYNARGSAYHALGNYEQAIYNFSKAIEIEPMFPHAYYNRGRAYSALEKYQDALSDFQKSIELSSAEFGYRAYGNIGLIYHRQGQYQKALEAFEESISYDNTKADAFFFRGETYTAQENYKAAIADYQAAIDRFSQYDKAYAALGFAYYKTGQYSQALDALDQVLNITPNSPAPYFYRMLVYLVTNDTGRATQEASQAVGLLATLTGDEQQPLLSRVSAELEAVARQNPDRAGDVNALVDLIPQPD